MFSVGGLTTCLNGCHLRIGVSALSLSQWQSVTSLHSGDVLAALSNGGQDGGLVVGCWDHTELEYCRVRYSITMHSTDAIEHAPGL